MVGKSPSMTMGVNKPQGNTEHVHIWRSVHGKNDVDNVHVRFVEFPTFWEHLKAKKNYGFNIGVAFLTLSLSSQLVSLRMQCSKLENTNEDLKEQVVLLEETLKKQGIKLPYMNDIEVKKIESKSSIPSINKKMLI